MNHVCDDGAGDTRAAELAHIYTEVGTLAFRLNKPLSCRCVSVRVYLCCYLVCV